MKIGYFATYFPYNDLLDDPEYYQRYAHGGTEVVAYNLAIGIRQRGHEVKVFTTSIDSHVLIEEYKKVTIYRYDTFFKYKSGKISLSLLIDPLKYDLDIIHAHISEPGIESAALKYVKKKKKPFIITLHGDPQENSESFIKRLYISFYTKHKLPKILSCADLIISPSRNYVDESRFLGKYKHKIRVITHGINVEQFQIKDSREECRKKLNIPVNKHIVLFVGHLGPYKGPHVLIETLPEVIKHVPDTMVLFAGSGEMKSNLKKLSEKIGVSKHVRFEGFIKESLKPLYYKSADVFVLPSINTLEIFGIVNLEAMASGLPVIASNLCGISEIIEDGKSGLLVPPSDVNALTNSIIYLLEDENLRKKMSANAIKRAKGYSWAKVAEETERVYREVLLR